MPVVGVLVDGDLAGVLAGGLFTAFVETCGLVGVAFAAGVFAAVAFAAGGFTTFEGAAAGGIGSSLGAAGGETTTAAATGSGGVAATGGRGVDLA